MVVETFPLACDGPFNWSATAQFYARRAIAGVERVDGERYRRTIEHEGAHGTIDVSPAGDGRSPLIARVEFPRASDLPAIAARLERIFGLDTDVAAIGEHLSADGLLAPLVRARPGLRIAGVWSDFELAVRAILGQQVTLAAARKLAGDLVAAFGRRVELGEDLTHVFPDAASLAGADVAGALAMPRARAESIRSLAAAAVDDPRLLDPEASIEAGIAKLRRLRGFGDWTANYVAMRAMREGDAFPASDAGLLRAMTRLTGVRPTPRALVERAEPWRPWRAYAAAWLWSFDASADRGERSREV